MHMGDNIAVVANLALSNTLEDAKVIGGMVAAPALEESCELRTISSLTPVCVKAP